MDSTDSRDLRPAGIAGWAAFVLLVAAQACMQSGGVPEPDFDAPLAGIQEYYATRVPTRYAIGAYLLVLALLALLWFVCGLATSLRRRLTGREWLPAVVLASGAVIVGAVLLGAGQAAAFRADAGLDPQVARFAFDVSSVTFANTWVAFGSLCVASGWAILAGRAQPRWLGWWALVAGVGFVASRAVWTSYLWLVPYALFWLWLLVVSTRMLRARG